MAGYWDLDRKRLKQGPMPQRNRTRTERSHETRCAALQRFHGHVSYVDTREVSVRSDIVREFLRSRKEGKEGLLSREPSIVAQQEDTSPEEGAKHEENPDVVREVSQPMIPFQ
jgi:hypothetical protein